MPWQPVVGPTGSLIGIFSAWLVLIFFRWDLWHRGTSSYHLRNYHLFWCLLALLMVIIYSVFFNYYTNWAVILGSFLMGVLLGVAAFFRFPHFPHHLIKVGFGALLLAIALFLISLYYLFYQYYFWYDGSYEYNDDWGKGHGGDGDGYWYWYSEKISE